VVLRDSVLNGADRFEADAERRTKREIPDFTVGDGSVIEHAILDKDCRIGRGVRIVNAQKPAERRWDNYVIRWHCRHPTAPVPDGTVI